MGTRITSLAIYASSEKKLNSCDIAIEPLALETIGVLDRKNIETAYNLGYEHGNRAIEAYLKTKNHRIG